MNSSWLVCCHVLPLYYVMHGVSIMFSNKSIIESEFQLVSMVLCFPSVLCHGVLVMAWITISDESDI